MNSLCNKCLNLNKDCSGMSENFTGCIYRKVFKHTERTTKIFNTIIEAYRNIESDNDLKSHGLTYDDYKSNEMGLTLDGLRLFGESETHNKNIAEWLNYYGCNVYMIADKWKIQL